MKSTINQKAISYNKTKIKTDKVLKVKNKGFVNYTFKVLVENAPTNEFYNLVVTEDDTKKIKKPYILKYVVDNDALLLFKANNNNFKYFKGNRYVVSFDNFFNSKKSNAKTTNETCPESTGYINNIPGGGFGGGSDGGINNVSPTNFVQPVFNYFPDNFTGYFELWMNSYDTATNQSTSIGGTVPNSTGVSIPSYQPSPINPVTGGSQISSLTITWQNFSLGGTFTYKYCNTPLDGKQECTFTTIYYYILDKPIEEVNERLTNETNDCPKPQGEIAVITPESPNCDPELQNVYGECPSENQFDTNFDGEISIIDDSDYNIDYFGEKALIPSQIILNNGKSVSITFGTTKDQVNANQPVAICLIDAIKYALNQTSDISSIHIHATTNGHDAYPNSNHLRATAIDISRINGIHITDLGNNSQVLALQVAFDNYHGIRENFGPSFKHKTESNGSNNNNFNITGHKDHIHISIQSNTTCN